MCLVGLKDTVQTGDQDLRFGSHHWLSACSNTSIFLPSCLAYKHIKCLNNA